MAGAIALSMLLFASIAAAQALDTVHLPGGGRILGTVEVYEPGRSVVVLLPDGTRRRLGPGEFERVVFADAPAAVETPPSSEAPPPATTTPIPTPPPQPPPTAPPTVDSLPTVETLPSIEALPPIEPAPATGPAAPADAAPTPGVQSIESAGAPVQVAARAFGDGRADELPWVEEDPGRIARPTGLFHIGAQVSLTGRLTNGGNYGVEVAPYVDLRLALAVHLRALVVVVGLADQGYERENAFGRRTTTVHGRGVFEVAGRLLLGLLASDGFVIRLGAQLGAEVLGHLDQTEEIVDGVLELAFRVLDSRLEILIGGVFGIRTQSTVQVSSSGPGGVSATTTEYVSIGVGGGLGYVFY